MKFLLSSLLLASLTSSAAAFSATVPRSTAPNLEPVDRTMEGIDAEGAFDPTEGENPALTRNNNDEVWVSQVSMQDVYKGIFRRGASFLCSALVPVATASRRPCVA